MTRYYAGCGSVPSPLGGVDILVAGGNGADTRADVFNIDSQVFLHVQLHALHRMDFCVVRYWRDKPLFQTWRSGASLPFPLREMGYLPYRDSLLLVGGATDGTTGTYSDSLVTFDTEAGEWVVLEYVNSNSISSILRDNLKWFVFPVRSSQEDASTLVWGGSVTSTASTLDVEQDVCLR